MIASSRLEYTAVGATVNLASRLEGASKNYGVALLLGEEDALPPAEYEGPIKHVQACR